MEKEQGFAASTTSNMGSTCQCSNIFLKVKWKAINSLDTVQGGLDRVSALDSIQFQPESPTGGRGKLHKHWGSSSSVPGWVRSTLPNPLAPRFEAHFPNHIPFPCRDWSITSEGSSRQAHLRAGAGPEQTWRAREFPQNPIQAVLSLTLQTLGASSVSGVPQLLKPLNPFKELDLKGITAYKIV